MANYNNYPYGNTYQPYGFQQTNYNQQMQPQQQQIPYIPLTYISGIVGAKAYIVAPNQTVFLKDSDEGSNLLFEKSADNFGRYTLKAYELKQISMDDIGKPKESKPNMEEYATKNDLKALQTLFESRMNDLSSMNKKDNIEQK